FHGLASNTQQFGVRESATSIIENAIVVAGNQRLKNKITKLIALVKQLPIGQHHISPPMRMCGICASIKHLIDACPILQETKPNNAAVAAMMGGQQYSLPSLEDLVKQMVTNNSQFQQNKFNLHRQQPLQPLVIIANNLQFEQEERLLQEEEA
ncbi:hypothetical protein CR513_42351, partial [Mucuna pruriens]